MKGLYKAFAGGDVAAVLGALDPGIQWREFRNGKVIRFQQYTDTRQWATAFGS